MAPKRVSSKKPEVKHEGKGPQQLDKSDECNAQLIICIQEALKVVLSHEAFVDILEALPLAIANSEDSGVQAPFNKSSYTTAPSSISPRPLASRSASLALSR